MRRRLGWCARGLAVVLIAGLVGLGVARADAPRWTAVSALLMHLGTGTNIPLETSSAQPLPVALYGGVLYPDTLCFDNTNRDTGLGRVSAGLFKITNCSTTNYAQLGTGGLNLQAAGVLGWSSTTDATAAADTAIKRTAAGALEVNSGSAGSYRDLIVRTLAIGATSGFTNGVILGTSGSIVGWQPSAGSASDAAFARTGAGLLEVNTGTVGTRAGLALAKIIATQASAPTCANNCGGSPVVAGSDFGFRVTLGTVVAASNTFAVKFNGTYTGTNPACVVTSAASGIATPVSAPSTATGVTVNTIGALANGGAYNIICPGLSG